MKLRDSDYRLLILNMKGWDSWTINFNSIIISFDNKLKGFFKKTNKEETKKKKKRILNMYKFLI